MAQNQFIFPVDVNLIDSDDAMSVTFQAIGRTPHRHFQLLRCGMSETTDISANMTVNDLISICIILSKNVELKSLTVTSREQ